MSTSKDTADAKQLRAKLAQALTVYQQFMKLMQEVEQCEKALLSAMTKRADREKLSDVRKKLAQLKK